MISETIPALSGGCLCGAVRYASSAAPIIEGNCHCRDCQKASGSAYAPTLFFPVQAVTITGDAKFFESIGGSGQPIRRGFCPNCGSQLFGLPLRVLPKSYNSTFTDWMSRWKLESAKALSQRCRQWNGRHCET